MYTQRTRGRLQLYTYPPPLFPPVHQGEIPFVVFTLAVPVEKLATNQEMNE